MSRPRCPHCDRCYVLTALSFILSGGCAGFSRSEEGSQSRHQTEGLKTQASGPVLSWELWSAQVPPAYAQSPLGHFLDTPLPSPFPGLKLAPCWQSLALSPGSFFHEPKALHSLKKEVGLNLLPMLQGGAGEAVGEPDQGDGLSASAPFPGGRGHLWPWKRGKLGSLSPCVGRLISDG